VSVTKGIDSTVNYQAALFDLDGVVIDTRRPVVEFWQRFAARHNVTIAPADYSRYIHGMPPEGTLAALFPHLTDEQRREYYDYLRDFEDNTVYRPVPGVKDLLLALRQAGIPAAVATSASRRKVEIVERQLGLQGLFAAHVTIDDITRGKPDPECYRTAAARLGKAPERCIVFEDAVIGVRAGVAAGARCIGIQPEADVAADLIRAGAWRVVPDFTALHVGVEGEGIWLKVNGGEALGLAASMR